MKIIIDTYGMHISFKNSMLIFEKDDKIINEVALLHITSLHIQTHTRISSEAIIQCINSNIPVYFETHQTIKAIIWSPTYGSIARIRKKQALFSYSPARYVITKRLLIRKNTERITFIKNVAHGQKAQELIKQLKEKISLLEQVENNDNKIRAVEALLSKNYFEIYNLILPKKFIMPKRTYKNSTDVTNIMLNYAYGILYNEVTKALIFAGLDPDLSFFHTPQYNKHALSFDIVEPYRAWAELWVLKTLKHPDIKNMDTLIEKDTLLAKPLKRLLITTATEWLTSKKIKRNKLIKTPLTHIQLDTHKLAQYILNLNEQELFKQLHQKYNTK